MKVSILITCYNLVESIEKSIISVMQLEKPFDWELLIGDDGSTDGTLDIIKKWALNYPDNIRYYVQKREIVEKTGVRAARNRANLLAKASGDYLTFLDGDDCFLGENKLVRQVGLLELQENHACSCCAHNIMAHYVKTNKSEPLFDTSVPMRKYTLEQYWPGTYFHTDTIVFRAKCKKMLLDPNYADFLNDNFITFCLFQFGDLLYIPDISARYVITGDGLWTGKSRAYGCFRNMMLYDLERSIKPELSKASFNRHLYDFYIIFKYYQKEGQDNVGDLIFNCSPEIFKMTWLLYKKNNLSYKERFIKCCFFIKTQIHRIITLIKIAFNKIIIWTSGLFLRR